ncbi:methyltransferase-like protein 25B [Chironomus tepperi]|uniref:methyltransferase-like protein 25B n=1 Tax=Chironomus tepperi TaxID=113505 RepID=UPI00391FA458
MFNFTDINQDYLEKLVDFLYSIAWMYKVLNTQYVKENVLDENRQFLSLLEHIDLNDFVNATEPQNHHPLELQKLIENVNYFRINFDIINTESWKCNNQQKRMSPKKLYEIENMSKLINEICKDDVTTLVDLGSGLGYLDEYLHTNYGYKIIGLEGSAKNQEQAVKRQEKYYAESIGKVKHVHHFITMDSGDFILNEVDDVNKVEELSEKLSNSSTSDIKPPKVALFGLHPCGDLSIVCIKLFLNIDRVKKLIFSPCCYHKMSGKDTDYTEFNYYPLSQTVKELESKYPTNPFLRPFLRLAGQQSPIKFKEMTEIEHFVHGKNMFERGVVEAILMDNETSKRINNTTFSEGRLKFEDIKVKYQLLDKSTSAPKQWTDEHEEKFNKIRNLHPKGEEMSENLFCLQTAVQNSCENLVIMDRIFYIYEQMKILNLNLKVSIKKLQNEKLSPRCLILIVEKS